MTVLRRRRRTEGNPRAVIWKFEPLCTALTVPQSIPERLTRVTFPLLEYCCGLAFWVPDVHTFIVFKSSELLKALSVMLIYAQ